MHLNMRSALIPALLLACPLQSMASPEPQAARSRSARHASASPAAEEGAPQAQPDGGEAQAQAAEEPSGPPPLADPVPGKHFSMKVERKDTRSVLRELARQAGIPMAFLYGSPNHLISMEFLGLPFPRAIQEILIAGGLECRLVDGIYQVGLKVDLDVRYPREGEKNLDAAYRCRRVSASNLADAISRIVPEVRVAFGPAFMTPSLDGNGGAGAGDNQLKVLGATDTSMKILEVVFSGPAASVRRALALAQRFDRPRAQVRIGVKIVRVSEDGTRQLGVSWQPSLAFSASEQPNSTAGSASVEGIRLGRFNHNPLAVQATLNALETKGKARILSNPTLTVLDGERSFVLSGSRFLYPKFTGKDQNGQSLYEVGEVKVGVYLQVGVHVGTDNDIMLTLYPQVSQKGEVLTASNGGLYPEVKTEEIQTTVRAISGQALVLGGLMQEGSTRSSTGLPFLSRIPVLGRLFGTGINTHTKSELMIVLTPELVEDEMPEGPVDLKMQDA